MTYPRTPEEKARSLGSRLACEAFNACGSLDARKCQEVGDAFGKAIADLIERVRIGVRWTLYKPGHDLLLAALAADPEPSYMRCRVCGKHRDRQVRELCGHDTDDAFGRRWCCSRECWAKVVAVTP